MDVLAAIARGWKVVLVVLAVCLSGAVAAYAYFPQQYAAVAVHTVEPISALSAGSSFNTVNMQTEQVVAGSRSVMDAAAAALGDGVDAQALESATTIEVPRNSQVLMFHVETEDPQQAADWANVIASAYGEQRAMTAQEVVDRTEAALSGAIVDLRGQLEQSEPQSPEAAAITQQLEAAISEQARLQSTPFFAGALITPAVAPTESNRPGLEIFLGGGLAFGLLLGALLALVLARTPPRAWAPADSPGKTTEPPFARHAAPLFPPVRSTKPEAPEYEPEIEPLNETTRDAMWAQTATPSTSEDPLAMALASSAITIDTPPRPFPIDALATPPRPYSLAALQQSQKNSQRSPFAPPAHRSTAAESASASALDADATPVRAEHSRMPTPDFDATPVRTEQAYSPGAEPTSSAENQSGVESGKGLPSRLRLRPHNRSGARRRRRV
ncbi:MAG: hypothetical protein ACK5KU_08185 [Beutenbergiaceae bacterium]